MKAKRIIALLLAVLMLVFASGCTKAEKKPEGATPLLYKVTDESGNTAWLFGSIHIGRDDFYPLPDYIMNAYEGSDALAVELDIVAFEKDMNAQMDVLIPMMYMDGTDITDHIPEEVYVSAVDILEENDLYNFALDYYIISLWWNFVDNCAYMQLDVDMEGGIDRFLINKAKEEGKEILEVESAELQYGMMANFSEELQLYLLEGSIEAYGDLDTAKADIDEMMDLWAEGDEEKFAAYLNEESDEEMTAEEEALYEEYNKAMLTDRNLGMADFAENALKSEKEVFICVGAAHIVGDGGLVELLRERGYTVESVR